VFTATIGAITYSVLNFFAPPRMAIPYAALVGVLAGIVLIRTFLSFTLEMEITGRWPWQSADR
jgi:hypothetical protein